MELLIPLDSESKMPLYEQIYRHIRKEIREGALGAGEKLPSSRILAENLKVSRSTVQMAYDQLLAEGYMETIPCRGCFVSRIEGLVGVEAVGQQGGKLTDGEESAGRDFPNPSDRGFSEKGNPLIDFSPRGIDLEKFPFSIWRKLTRDTLVDGNRELFQAGDPRGELSLRREIRTYLHSARGVNCQEDQIIVGAGSEYLLMLLSRILGPKHRIAMENPTYKQAYRVLSGEGYDVVPVDMDHSGMRADLLKKSGADIAYVMPSHQYPMGVVMPITRRQELLAWAWREEERFIIEDDYDSEFRYKGIPVPALQGMDQKERVIYMGTFSKSIAPAIRVGFLVLPRTLLPLYRERAAFYASTVSRIDQNVLCQFMVGGHYERHLNRMRALYRGKHDALLTALKPLEREFEIQGENAGLHVLMTSRKGIAEERLVELANEMGVKVYGLSAYFIRQEQNHYPPTVILGYASLTIEQIQKGASQLLRAWKDVEKC